MTHLMEIRRGARGGIALLAAWIVTLTPGTIAAAATSTPVDELADLSIEELLHIEVTSVSRKRESLRDAAAAIHVLTREDLRRSGARTLPDALRLVPGMYVAQIDDTKWAVTARGFNRRFANTLLVLQDGRELYSPYFSGVFWDTQHIPFDSIERIEVIRGPGATLWGSNAVNGIINIITRTAADQQGWWAQVGAGSAGNRNATARYGGELDSNWHYSAFADYLEADVTTLRIGSDDGDEWRNLRTGFRLDGEDRRGDLWSFQGSIYRGESQETIQVLLPAPYRAEFVRDDHDTEGGWLSFQWRRAQASGDYSLSGHVEQARRDSLIFNTEQRTASLNFQHRRTLGSRHDLVWGLGATLSDLPIRSATGSFTQEIVNDEKQRLLQFYIQDEIQLARSVRLMLGTKVEDTEYTGTEVQPNIRLAWQASGTVNFWAAASHAVRTPSRGESHVRVNVPIVLPAFSPVNPTPLPLTLAIEGSTALKSETLDAFEAGIRWTPGRAFDLDVALFRNHYDDLVSSTRGETLCLPSGTPLSADPTCLFLSDRLQLLNDLGNDGERKTQGLEASWNWRPGQTFRLSGTISLFDRVGAAPDATAQGVNLAAAVGEPEYAGTLSAHWNPLSRLELDVTLRTMDEAARFGIDDYVTADLRASWQATRNLSVELQGRNLFDEGHLEYASELGDAPPAEIDTTLMLRLVWTP